MSVQVLVAAMHQYDHSLLERMNIQGDAIIGNQCNRNEIESFKFKEHDIIYLNFAERGVGLNRNNALMRATGTICLFADDDMRYVDGYTEIVEKAFEDNPKADVILFNIYERTPKRFVNKSVKRVGYTNFLRYGAARIAIKLDSVRFNGIYFNQCFGGGTEHSAGEDNIFLASCLKKGLRVYTSTEYIAELTDNRESSWFKGYNEKYLNDQGYLFRSISKKWWKLLCFQDSIRHTKRYQMPFYKSYKIMTNI